MAEELTRNREAQQLGERVLATLNDTIEVDDIELNISASIGIAVYPLHGSNIKTLIDEADKAMYQAKRLGKSQVQIADLAQVSRTASDTRV